MCGPAYPQIDAAVNEADRRKRNSFTKMQAMMGEEGTGAAELVAANMHKVEGETANANVAKTMDKMGAAKSDAQQQAEGDAPKGGGCCTVQ